MIALRDTTQPSSGVGPGGLLIDFLTPTIPHRTSCQRTWYRWKQIGLSQL